MLLFTCVLTEWENRAPNNRDWPQARGPSKCLNGRSYGERLAKEAFWSPATRGLKKDSDRAVTPAVEAVCVPCTLGTARVPASQAAAPPSQSVLTGAELPRGGWDMCCVYSHSVASVLFNSLRPCRLWPARLLCQRWGSPGKTTGVYWPILVAIPSRALYFLLPYLPTPLSTWRCQNPWDPSTCTTSTPGPHRSKPKPSRAASEAKPQWMIPM